MIAKRPRGVERLIRQIVKWENCEIATELMDTEDKSLVLLAASERGYKVRKLESESSSKVKGEGSKPETGKRQGFVEFVGFIGFGEEQESKVEGKRLTSSVLASKPSSYSPSAPL